jgi:hypothetical protein
VDEILVLSQPYNREVAEDEIVLIRFSRSCSYFRAADRRSEDSCAIGASHSSHATANADAIGAERWDSDDSSPPLRARRGQLALVVE